VFSLLKILNLHQKNNSRQLDGRRVFSDREVIKNNIVLI
jgi:hypothetical protein